VYVVTFSYTHSNQTQPNFLHILIAMFSVPEQKRYRRRLHVYCIVFNETAF